MMIKNVINLEQLYQSETLSDVVFLLKNRSGDDAKMHAHRLILVSRSPVFEAMFNGKLDIGATVTITDASAEGFAEFLKFFYLSEFELAIENIDEVLKLIDKYDASAFWPMCEEFVLRTLDIASAHRYYVLALSFDLSDEIKEKAVGLICKDLETALSHADSSLSVIALKQILTSDKLIGPEKKIFDAVMSHAARSLELTGKPVSVDNIKEELGDCLNCIRFPAMQANELLTCLEKYPGILSYDVLLDCLQYIISMRPLSTAAIFSAEGRKRRY